MGKILHDELQNREWIEEKYVREGKSIQDIAREIHASKSTVEKAMKRNGIETKKPYSKIKHELLHDEVWLRKQYETKSTAKIAKETGADHENVRYCMKKFGIMARKRTELTGELASNWKGGKSFEPYCKKFDKNVKELIRSKFNNRCYICGTNKNKRKLNVHHVDYNKNTLCNGKTWGLIPLCDRHHSKTNFNRWYWFNLLGNYWATKYWRD